MRCILLRTAWEADFLAHGSQRPGVGGRREAVLAMFFFLNALVSEGKSVENNDEYGNSPICWGSGCALRAVTIE